MADTSLLSSYTGAVYGNSTSAAASTAKSTSNSEYGLSMDSFLTMFMAQLTNQDPLNPMDNTQFTAQLATFSQLEQLTKIASNTSKLENVESAIYSSQYTNYIGKDVTFSGNTVPVSEGSAGALNYELASEAYVQVVVYDSSGSIVHAEDLGRQTAGEQTYQWDATDSYGNTVDDGAYTVSIVASDSEGNAVTVSNQTTSGLVTGYQKGTDGTHYLMMGNSALDASSVLSVKQSSSAASTGTTDETSAVYSTLAALLGLI